MRPISWILALVSVAAGVIGWSEWKQTRRYEAALREAQLHAKQLSGRLAALSRKAHELPVQHSLPTSAPVKSAAVTRDSLMADMKAQSEATQRTQDNSPALQNRFLALRRAQHRAMFGALFWRLKLSPEQQEAFLRAVVGWDERVQDLQAIARAKGWSRNAPELKAQYDEAEAAQRSQIVAVLGPDALQITREFSTATRIRDYVASCDGMLSRFGLPLTPEQSEALTAAIIDCSPKLFNEPRLRLTPAQWDQFAARAQAVLSPEQWRALESATPPGVATSRWDATLEDLLTKAAGPNQ